MPSTLSSWTTAPSDLRMVFVLLPLLLTAFLFAKSGAQVPEIRKNRTFKLKMSKQVAEGMVLLTNNATKPIGCGFSSVQCFNRRQKCLVFTVSFLGDDGGILPDRLVWTANGNNPVPAGSTIELTAEGDLVLKDLKGAIAWSTNTSNKGVQVLKLKQSGNLVLLTANGTEVWRSFDHPTDTIMPEQFLRVGNTLQAYKSPSALDLSSGTYSLSVEKRAVVLYINNTVDSTLFPYAIWPLRATVNSSIDMLKFSRRDGNLQLVSANKTLLDRTRLKIRDKSLLFMRLEHEGSLKLYFENGQMFGLNKKVDGSKFVVALRGECSLPLKCGPRGICTEYGRCSCPGSSNDFQVVKRSCQARWTLPTCSENNGSLPRLVEVQNTDYFSTHFTGSNHIQVASADDCRKMCLGNCSCDVAIFKIVNNRSLCYSFQNALTLMNVTGRNVTSIAFVKVGNPPAPSTRGRTTLWITLSFAVFTVLLIPVTLLYIRRLKNRHKNHLSDELLESIPGVPRRFTFAELKAASANFSRKLGRGGFGTVYHGMLEDGTKVAIKRLERSQATGDDQFRAEVIAIGSVHHSNLVRLIGFCYDEQHKHTLLVYEYMPNGSLDMWIFAPSEKNSSRLLDWKTRSKIALDIAKGLAYLHESCEQSILHLDIKPQNILLDVEFKAKISDFGLAIFAAKGINLGLGILRGTPGYMAPEWLHCQVSAKIDVYSFGIVLLEIVSGKQALEFLDAMLSSYMLQQREDGSDGDRSCLQHQQEQQEDDGGRDRLSLQQQQQEEEDDGGRARSSSPDNFLIDKDCLMELLDSRLQDSSSWSIYSRHEVERFVLVALCCVQDDPSARPSMANVVKMLEGNLQVPDALLSLRHQTTALPLGIASFLASKSRLARTDS